MAAAHLVEMMLPFIIGLMCMLVAIVTENPLTRLSSAATCAACFYLAFQAYEAAIATFAAV